MDIATPSNAAVDKQTAALVHYTAMCREIALCARIDEVKDIRDKAMALAVYAKQALNHDAERQAAEIRLRAEIRAGEILKDTDMNLGGRPSNNRSDSPTGIPTLDKLGVSKDQSSQWQQLADIPKSEVEVYIAEPSQIPTANGLLNYHRAVHTEPEKQQPKVDPYGLRVWGILRDFERDEILNMKRSQLFRHMPATMRNDIARLAPLVSKWLHQLTKGE